MIVGDVCNRRIPTAARTTTVLAAAKAREAGVHAETALIKTEGRRVAAVIVEEAEGASSDLVIMGTHGRRGVEHLLLGSVAEGVVRRATVPVLLLRGR
jgi:nucleotide-binding universal stress UspA family protein